MRKLTEAGSWRRLNVSVSAASVGRLFGSSFGVCSLTSSAVGLIAIGGCCLPQTLQILASSIHYSFLVAPLPCNSGLFSLMLRTATSSADNLSTVYRTQQFHLVIGGFDNTLPIFGPAGAIISNLAAYHNKVLDTSLQKTTYDPCCKFSYRVTTGGDSSGRSQSPCMSTP
jgi:hypothetical protein